MILFHSIHDFELKEKATIEAWLSEIIKTEKKTIGEINYIFCDDAYLLEINRKYLDHDTYTDIISFDYTQGNCISGDIYISTERVAENAVNFKTSFDNELHRVMAHGILHYCGYKDKSAEEQKIMRQKEDSYLARILEV